MQLSEKEMEEVGKRMEEIKSLLNEFGLSLVAFDPGVGAARYEPYYQYIDMDYSTWLWIEPLLKELRDKRKNTGA